MTGLIDFSIVADENGTAAAPIYWPEGMPASAVNNSSREGMAALARWHRDNAGLSLAAINGSAVSLTSFQGIKSQHFDTSFRIVFALQQANAGPVSLSIDGSTPRPWRRARGFEFAPGDLAPFVYHDVIWSPVLNYFVSLAPTLSTPGALGKFGTVDAIPPGWLECDGRAVSRSVYSALFAAIGVTYGAGDGSTTFNIPDANGRATFGRDNGKGRLAGTGGVAGIVGSVGGAESIKLTIAQLPSHTHTGTTGDAGAQPATTTGGGGAHNHGGSTGNAGSHNHTGTTGGAGSHSHGGTTGNAGNHVHNQNYERLSIYGGGGQLSAVSQLFPPGNNSAATSEAAGVHQHTFTTDSVGDHAHNFTTSGAGDHAHGIPDADNHTHTIPSIPGHNHSVSLTPSGDDIPHSNMPPSLVVVIAIKA